MAEFLIRETNVAIPEVDIGDDIVVVRDDNDQITRVQVKTTNATEIGPDTFKAQFSIPIQQLESGPPQLVYAFVVRRNLRWEEFVIIRRSVLEQLRIEYGALNETNKKQTLSLTFRKLKSCPSLSQCQSLKKVYLNSCLCLSHVSGLGNCQSLQTLDLRSCPSLSDVRGLGTASRCRRSSSIPAVRCRM